MTYPYTAENRLLKPHSYMYTPFEGEVFLKEYLIERHIHQDALEAHLHAASDFSDLSATLLTICVEPIQQWLNQLANKITISNDLHRLQSKIDLPYRPLPATSVIPPDADKWLEDGISIEDIDTMHLLLCLLGIANTDYVSIQNIVKIWLDRLVQRFEVTKRLFTGYLRGLRKPQGDSDNLLLYGLFSVILGLYSGQSVNLKYLNTLLKVNDLLCSVQNDVVSEQAVNVSAYLALLFEELFILDLLSSKGLSNAVK